MAMRHTPPPRGAALVSQSFNIRKISPPKLLYDELSFTRAKSDEGVSEEKVKRAELGHAGVGCKLGEGSQGWPIVRIVSSKGSMDREGTIFPGAIITHVDDMDTKNMPLLDVTSAISGVLGTMVSLTVRDHLADSERWVVLTRATPQYWDVWDEMVSAQQALTMATKEAGSQRQETTSLNSDVAMLREKLREADSSAGRLRTMYEEEARRAYRAEIESGTLRKEKEFLESGVDLMGRNLAENAHMLRMAERVGRDMLARAVASEKARGNEEAMRRAAEAREGKLKEEMADMASRNGKYHKRLTELEHRVSASQVELKAKDGVEGAIGKVFTDMMEMRKQVADALSSKMEALAERERCVAESDDLAKKVKGLEGMLQASNEVIRSLKGEMGGSSRMGIEVAGGSRQGEPDGMVEQEVRGADSAAAASVAIADALQRAVVAEQRSSELSGKVKELQEEISEEYQLRVREARESAKALESAKQELSEARYTIETTRRNGEEALRGAQAAAKELEAKHAGVIKTSSSLMKQVEELREELARSASHDSASELRSMQLQALKDSNALSLKNSELQQAVSQLAASQAEANGLRKSVEDLERRWTEAPTRPVLQTGIVTGRGDGGGGEDRGAMEEGRRAVIQLTVLKEQLQGVENGLAAAIEREQKLSEQIISADEVIRGMERDSESLREQLTKVTEAYRMSCPLSEKVELAARCEAAEKQVMSLETEARRALESEAIARVELEDLVRRYEVLQKDSSDESTRLRSDLRLKETRLLSKAGALEEKVESLERQLAFYKGLPENVSVGLEIKEVFSNKGGKMMRAYKVIGLSVGTTAALCQVFEMGDVLFAIDGTPCEDLTYQNILERMEGKRGSLVSLDLLRAGLAVGEDGVQAILRAKVKRGGYGPEHAVVVLISATAEHKEKLAKLGGSSSRLVC